MTTFQGLVDAQGHIIRRRGQFEVTHPSGQPWKIRFPGQNVQRAFALFTPWAPTDDTGNPRLTVWVDRHTTDTLGLHMTEGVSGFSFRVET